MISSSCTALSGVARETLINNAVQGDDKALYILNTYAHRGCSISQGVLGLMYYIGRGVEKDYDKAFKWTKLSAKKEKKEALGLLGEMYYYGRGTSQSYRKAFIAFKKAAEKGDNTAQKWLGKMYYNGEGTRKDLVQAYKWWSLSKMVGNDFIQESGIERMMSPSEITQGRMLAMTWRRRH